MARRPIALAKGHPRRRFSGAARLTCARAAVVEGRPFVIGGQPGYTATSAAVHEYDPVADAGRRRVNRGNPADLPAGSLPVLAPALRATTHADPAAAGSPR